MIGRRLAALSLIATLAFAHSGDRRNLKPSKAAAELKRARRLQKEGKVQEFQKVMLACKRVMAGERRYSCCIRGGCNECAFEQECACGSNLANRNGKGVCKECYAGWHAGRGLYDGVPLAEVKVTPMEHDPSEGMSPETAQSGLWMSGTSQAPRVTPMYMTHARLGNWMLLTMGQGNLVYSAQSSPGGDKLFSGNWLMPMASRRLGPGRLTFRSMFSFEPATVTGGSYPLLFQSGETYRGRPIVNGQHPHSFLMELAATYTVPLSDRTSVFFYGGPRGEPALGPSAYAHRLSQSENPMATLGHHYQDSTHIANNVVTAGITHRRVTLEASGFNGREPGERRWALERGAIDSFSSRITISPTSRWSIQVSGGALTSPEVLHPGENATRITASATYVRPLRQGHWATTGLWGRTAKHDPFHSYLGESTLKWNRHWLWTRFEWVHRDATLLGRDEEDRVGHVSAWTFGYARELRRPVPWISAAIGGQFMIFQPGEPFRPRYGSAPIGAQVFLRFRLVPKDRAGS